MTWEDVIREANVSIEMLQTFIAEDPANRDKYDKKLAVMRWYKQEAIKKQNETIQITLDKLEQKQEL
jgi:hypothetical protein